MRLPRLWLFAFWASLLQTDPSFAQAAGPDPDEATSAAKPNVVVLSNNETLAQRVRGHTVELDADVVVRAETPVGSWSQQAMLARAVAGRTGTALVVWLSDIASVSGEAAAERRAFVAILLCEADRLYIRDLGPTSEAASPTDTSAVLELAALSTRAALDSLDAQESLGVPLSQLPSDAPEPGGTTTPAAGLSATQESSKPEVSAGPPKSPSPERATHPRSRDPILSEPTREEPPSASSLPFPAARAVVGLGAGAHLDGVTPLTWPSPALQLGAQWPGARILLGGELGFGRSIQETEATITVQRQLLLLQGEIALGPTHNTFVPWLFGAGGVVVHRRATEAHGGQAVPTPARTLWSAIVRSGLAFEMQPGSWRHHRLRAATGVDLITHPPTIATVAPGGTPLRSYTLHTWQPHANLAWILIW